MKPLRKILIVALALVLVTAGIWWRHSHNRSDAVADTEKSGSVNSAKGENGGILTHEAEIHAVESNQPDFAQAAELNKQQLANIGITPGMTKEQMADKYREWYISQASKLVPEQKQIKFFGRVVDEQLQSVANATVHFVLSTTLSSNGTSESETSSASDGSFSLAGTTGSGIDIHVTKEGYYEVRSLNQHYYDPTGTGSSANSPVLFHLRKKGPGADLITSQYGFKNDIAVSAPRDGSPVRVDFFNRTTSPNGQMEISQIKPAYGTWQTATEWSYKLRIPDGGFVGTSDEFPFEAPESGYQPELAFHFEKDQTNWTDTIETNYYIEFGNPPKYGRIHIRTTWMTGTSVEYAINPDGSRNLEPKQ